MNVIEETIEAMLDSSGQLLLTQPARLPPGPVQVTIRVAGAGGQVRGLADVVQEIASEQRAAISPDAQRKNCAPKTMRAGPRMPSETKSSMRRATCPCRENRECFTTWIP